MFIFVASKSKVIVLAAPMFFISNWYERVCKHFISDKKHGTDGVDNIYSHGDVMYSFIRISSPFLDNTFVLGESFDMLCSNRILSNII